VEGSKCDKKVTERGKKHIRRRTTAII